MAGPELGSEDALAQDIAEYELDPLGFARYAFPWGERGTPLERHPGLRAWQEAYLDELGQQLRRVFAEGGDVQAAVADALAELDNTVLRFSVSSGHGIGKSAIVSILLLWCLATYEMSRAVVTANTETQLKNKTWPELAKWHSMCICGHWFKYTATSLFRDSPEPEVQKQWRIDLVPWSETNTEAFAGLHNEGRRIMLVFDEGSAIPDKIWEVAEGALTDEGTQIIWVVFGNPTRATGRFRECWRRWRHRWTSWQIDSREVEGTNKAQIAEWVKDHGEDSDFVKVRVRGVFPSQAARQFISEEDADAGFGRHAPDGSYNFAPKILSVEPAWTGDDELVIGMRQGITYKTLRTLERNDNDLTVASIVAQIDDDEGADAVFIDLGYGTGIYSAGQTWGRSHWELVAFGERAANPMYLNKRAEMWGEMKQWLKRGGCYPADERMRQELMGPETRPRVDGRVQLESKDDMKKRGEPSPNRADALALTFAYPVAGRKREADTRQLRAITDYDPLEG